MNATPLVSIDLVLRDAAGRILLGLRKNRPAQGFWFVPGGRVHKNETLDEAFRRLSLTELGCSLNRDHDRLIGVYEHFYADSVFGFDNASPSTHYIVLAYEITYEFLGQAAFPLTQHEKFHWWSIADALASSSVHENTKDYLRIFIS